MAKKIAQGIIYSSIIWHTSLFFIDKLINLFFFSAIFEELDTVINPSFTILLRNLMSTTSNVFNQVPWASQTWFYFDQSFRLRKTFLNRTKEWRIRRQQAHVMFRVLEKLFTIGDVWMEALSITKKWGSALVWSSFFMIPLIKSLKISPVVLWDKVGYQAYGSKWMTLIFHWLSSISVCPFCGLAGHRRSNHPQCLYNIRRIRTVSEPNGDHPHCNNHISASSTSLLPLTWDCIVI